jgi:4-fold beta-flower domain-containing protein
MKTMKIGLLFLIPMMLILRLAVGQTSTAVPKMTDLFSADEMKKAGLSKLNPDEIAALNVAFFRILIQLNSNSESHTVSSTASGNESKDADFYDSRGRAVAYIAGDRDLTIYLWTGEPIAYLDEDSVFGFNGKHLGWLKSGAIYDHDGDMIAALSDRFKEPVTTPPLKSFKQFLPFKSFKEFKPFKPFFSLKWSEVPARIFFLGGAQ